MIRRFINKFRMLKKLIPAVWRFEDFDYSYGLQIELTYLKVLRDGLARYNSLVSSEYHVQTMNKTIRVLEEIIKDDIDASNYVNSRNWKRFYSSSNVDRLEDYFNGEKDLLMMSDLRLRKLWHLYHSMKEHYMESWWD